MGLFDGKLGWDDALFFPAAITDGAIEGFDRTVGGGTGKIGNPMGGSKAPTPNFNVARYGGDPVVSDAYRNQFQRGIQSGSGQVDQGMGLLGTSAQAGGVLQRGGYAATQAGMDAYGRGLGYADQSRGNQMEAARLQYLAATGQAPSQAQMLMQGAADQQAQQMMAQAQAARGGNAASAMRGAQYQAAANNAQMAQQMGALRAQEMAQARGAYGDLSGAIRGQDLGYAGLGGQMVGTGFNAQQAGMQGIGQAGAQMGQIGVAREGNYLGALTDQQKSEMVGRTDLENTRIGGIVQQRANNQAFMGGLVGTGGAVLGGIYGGPAGAAAGGQAGQQIGRKAAG